MKDRWYWNERPTIVSRLFTVAAEVGTSRANRCQRLNDEYDRRGGRRHRERYRGETATGIGLGVLVAGIIDGILIASFPKR